MVLAAPGTWPVKFFINFRGGGWTVSIQRFVHLNKQGVSNKYTVLPMPRQAMPAQQQRPVFDYGSARTIPQKFSA